MFRILGRLFCLVTTAVSLGSVAWMSTAFAQLPPPEVPVPPGSGSKGSGGSSWATNVGWMLIGAGVLVAIAVLVGLTLLAVQRHRPTGRLRSA